MGLKDLYLIAYNLLCCAGWAVVCKTAVTSIVVDLSDSHTYTLASVVQALADVYKAPHLAQVLWYSQMAALLEVVHALLGFVRSPVLVTAMQVASRIVALVAVTYSTSARGECNIMSLSV
jgi:very-long-chain (3R)-3-hydroxyacyl-CoA dehydratase